MVIWKCIGNRDVYDDFKKELLKFVLLISIFGRASKGFTSV